MREGFICEGRDLKESEEGQERKGGNSQKKDRSIRGRPSRKTFFLDVGEEGGEGVVDVLGEVVVEVDDLGGVVLWVDEFRVDDLLDGGGEGGLDDGPGDLGVGGRVGDGLLGVVVEGHDGLEHADGLGEGAGVVVVGEGVLLEEVFADDLGDFHDDLLVFREGLLADELDDLRQGILLLEDLAGAVAEEGVLGVEVVEEGLEDAHVLGVGNKPVQGGKVLALGELLVEAPKDLDDR
mmetsp:Transcript_28263/g.91122  ORF Transcript_28263/g.91122 Transcript_28263/m.91122 type:complete len:236 (-) Transcript_28263:1368-2075(-)